MHANASRSHILFVLLLVYLSSLVAAIATSLDNTFGIPTNKMTKIKLTYFDIEGAAEPTRLALALAGQEFEDVRVSFADWKDLKPKTPYGQLPLMNIDDGPVQTQSGAMLRWVGTACSETLYPRDKVYAIEEAMGVVGDLISAFQPCLYMAMSPQKYGRPEGFQTTEEGKELIKTMRENFVKNDLPNFLGRIEGLLEKGGTQWIAGTDEPTIADCFAIPQLRNLTRGYLDHIDPKSLETHPKVMEYVKRFCDLPQIKGRYSTGLGSPAYN
jgi:glutathione S-transferase